MEICFNSYKITDLSTAKTICESVHKCIRCWYKFYKQSVPI